MFAPDIFSLEFDDDLFQNLKKEIIENEKWKNATSFLKIERMVNNSFNSIGLIKSDVDVAWLFDHEEIGQNW